MNAVISFPPEVALPRVYVTYSFDFNERIVKSNIIIKINMNFPRTCYFLGLHPIREK